MEHIIADVSGLRLTLTRQGASPTSWPGQRQSSPASSTSSRTSRRRTGTSSRGLCLILGPECVPVCGRAEKYLVTSQRDSSLIAQNISMTWPGKSNHRWNAQHSVRVLFLGWSLIMEPSLAGGFLPPCWYQKHIRGKSGYVEWDKQLRFAELCLVYNTWGRSPRVL